MSDQAKVTCPHCMVQFGFAVPSKYIANPEKSIKFVCAYCKEKFAVVVRDLFSDDDAGIVSEKIRHQSHEGLQLYNDWEDLMLAHIDSPILEQDPISAFGGEWKPAFLHSELQSIFPNIVEDDSVEEPVPTLQTEEQSPVFVDDEQEDPEEDLFAEGSEDVPWEQIGMSDPFDIPISDESSDDTSYKIFTDEVDHDMVAEGADTDELSELIAFGAMDTVFDDSDSAPEAAPIEVEDSEDPFLAISDEVIPERGEHSIDALINSLEGASTPKQTEIGVNTLDLLQSEEVLSDLEPPQTSVAQEYDVAMEYEDSEESGFDVPKVVSPPQEETSEEDFENMKTVVGESFHPEEEEESPLTSRFTQNDNKDFLLATVTTITEEPSEEEDIALTKTVISRADFDFEDDNDKTYEVVPEASSTTSYNPYEPTIWASEEEKTGESDSLEDFDQTEEEESQSVLNPAFQVSTKNVARRQYFSVGVGVALAASAVLLLSNYVSLSSVYNWIIPVDEQELLMAQEQQIKKQQEANDTAQNTAQVQPTEAKKPEEPIAQTTQDKEVVSEEKVPEKMVVVAPEKSVYLDDTPLAKKEKSQSPPQKNPQKTLPPMDPAKATREGWIKIEDQSYESAKRIFESVIEQDPNPRAFMGIGFAEERLADRYKERKDQLRVEEQYDAAHKYYCAAMDYYIEKENMTQEERFGFLYVQARLKTISRGCG